MPVAAIYRDVMVEKCSCIFDTSAILAMDGPYAENAGAIFCPWRSYAAGAGCAGAASCSTHNELIATVPSHRIVSDNLLPMESRT